MKKIFALLLLLVAVTSSAQVRVIATAEPQKTDNKFKYDSLSNYIHNLPGLVTRFLGQELFLIPDFGDDTDYFYKDLDSKEHIPFAKFYGKTFKVDDVVDNNIGGRVLGHYIKLVEEDSNDTVYFKHTFYESLFPFIILGYKKKFEDTHKGVSYVYTTEYSFGTSNDINTGEKVSMKAGSIWEFEEIVTSKTKKIIYLYKNESGNVIDADPSDFITLKEYNNLIKKYGKPLCQKAISKTIAIGMPKELVRIAWGSPDRINDASYGDQWVYKFSDGTKYVYIKRGKVTGWN